jgi:spore germination cell wall hydrolase CwlJ-like protein
MADLFDRPFGIVCLIAEASSQSVLCQQAIAGVLRNRVKEGRYERTIAGVVCQRYQFSEFLPDKNDSDNLERVLNLPDNAPEILEAAAAYDAVMADENFDPSQGADHFYADGIPAPAWAAPPGVLTVKIDAVNFWKAA